MTHHTIHLIRHHTTWVDYLSLTPLAIVAALLAAQQQWVPTTQLLIMIALILLSTVMVAYVRCEEPYIRLGHAAATVLRDKGIHFEGCANG